MHFYVKHDTIQILIPASARPQGGLSHQPGVLKNPRVLGKEGCGMRWSLAGIFKFFRNAATRRRLRRQAQKFRKIVGERLEQFTIIFYRQTTVCPEYLKVDQNTVMCQDSNAPEFADWIAARADDGESIKQAIEMVLEAVPKGRVPLYWSVNAIPDQDLTPMKNRLFGVEG